VAYSHHRVWYVRINRTFDAEFQLLKIEVWKVDEHTTNTTHPRSPRTARLPEPQLFDIISISLDGTTGIPVVNKPLVLELELLFLRPPIFPV